MPAVRGAVLAAVLVLAVVSQVAVFSALSLEGVVPNLVLLVVVAAALVRGPEFAAVLGFLGGLAVDLAPPADHVAGRWALALMLVGYVAGRMRTPGSPTLVAMVGTAAACSFVGTSTFALTGLVLRDSAVGVPGLIEVLLVALVWDLLLALLVLPAVLALFARAEPDRALA